MCIDDGCHRVCFDVESAGHDTVVNLAYSESPFFAGPIPDATTDRQERDLPLRFEFGKRTGTTCVAPEFLRGGFKYLTVQMPYASSASDETKESQNSGSSRLWDALDAAGFAGQKVLGVDNPKQLSSYLRSGSRDQQYVSLRNIWVNCTAFPSQSNGRAYTGYFSSSSPLLNRIWYAGAYTLQLSTIDPKEGSALIDYNRPLDGNTSPTGSWYNNFTISPGNAVTTDGAKRDRVVWPGDMYVAITGIAVSTYDMAAVRNALDVLFEHQYSDGSLPYAGPPLGFRGEFSDTYHLHTLLGVYNYVLYSGDVAWLKRRWSQYIRALEASMEKVDDLGLLHVSSTADWLRRGMTGHNIEATAILYETLRRTEELSGFLGTSGGFLLEGSKLTVQDMAAMKQTLEQGITRLYCNDSGLFSDNVGRRGCYGPERCDPQDGNSWALISGMKLLNATATATNISQNLRARWQKFGAPAVEFPNVISPFASSFELMGHCAAGNEDAAVELMLLEWGYLLDGPGFTNSTLAEGFRTDGYVHYPAYPNAPRNSHAHGWAAGPTGVLVNSILGIHLLGPAGNEWVIRPYLTKWLGWARGGFATGLGKFEVSLTRVVAVDVKGHVAWRGQVVVLNTPPGTKGSLQVRLPPSFGHMQMLTYALEGGDTAVQAIGEGGDQHTLEAAVFADIVFEEQVAKDWSHLPGAPFAPGHKLKYDDDFEADKMEERAAGVVDWETLEENYAPRLWERQY